MTNTLDILNTLQKVDYLTDLFEEAINSLNTNEHFDQLSHSDQQTAINIFYFFLDRESILITDDIIHKIAMQGSHNLLKALKRYGYTVVTEENNNDSRLVVYAQLLRKYVDESQSLGWTGESIHFEKVDELHAQYRRKMERLFTRLEREYGFDKQKFYALQDQAMMF
jgi:hypothetical protein